MMIDENNNEKFNAIVESICYWLGYQFKIGRDRFIHEGSLRYPIADTITAKGIAIKRIELEKTSPIFKQRYIDLVIFDKTVKEPEKEKNDDKLSEVYEFKLAKNETSKEYHFDPLNALAFRLRIREQNANAAHRCPERQSGKVRKNR